MKAVYIALIALVVVTGSLMIIRGARQEDPVRTLPVQSVEKERTL